MKTRNMQTMARVCAIGLLGIPTIFYARHASARAVTPPVTEQCRPTSVRDVAALLRKASRVMGLDSVAGRVRRSAIVELNNDEFQADRMYPPTPYRLVNSTYVVDLDQRIQGRVRTLPPNAPAAMAAQFKPGLTQLPTDRPMDPWMVVTDWMNNPDGEKVTQECYYRDFWRTVITRPDSAHGGERLFIDTKTGYPVKLDRHEINLLWGDRFTEYVWTTWLQFGQANAPRSAFMVTDGETERAWTHSGYTLLSRDSVGVPVMPSPPSVPPQFSNTPDTVRINDNTFALVTLPYSNVVTLQHDTVYILDAQMGEERARADSVWIGKLFKGRHPLVLVVTDLAWPHIAGVRYWVANGVPVITHRASRDFLLEVLHHPWTVHPDLFEKRRATLHPSIRGIDTALKLAGGDITLAPIDGIASEGALMAYEPRDHFIYVGDYIQQGSLGAPKPNFLRFTYMDEVIAAAHKNGFEPVTFSAMHVTPTPWSAVLATTH